MQLVKRGSTDVSTQIRIIDSTAFTPEEAVEHDTSGIALWYWRKGATKISITPAALASLDAAHSDGGIEHCDDGYYRLDLPDAACASSAGVDWVMIGGTVTGMIVIGQLIILAAIDHFDSVRAGMTALPNAAADAAGGLPISDAGGLDIDTKLANTNEVTAARMGALTDLIDGGRLDLLIDAIKAKTDNLPADPADDSDIDTQLAAIAGYIDTEVASILAAVDTEVAAIKAVTDNLPDAGALSSLATAAKLLKYVQLLTRKDAANETDRAAELTEINADGGSGAGSFSAQSDSLEANRDNIGTAGANLSVAIGTGGIAVGSFATNSITADAAAADFATELQAAITAKIQVKKNTELVAFPFLMTDSTNHAPAASLTVSAYRSIDGAAFAGCANAVSEIGNGWYKITLAAADLNGNTIALRFTATGADDLNITLVTQS